MKRALYLLSLILLLVSLTTGAEARSKAPTKQPKQPAPVRPSKKTEKKQASRQRRGVITEALKHEAREKPAVFVPDELLLAEARGGLTALEEAALPLIGTRYRFGGTSESGIDCSAFVRKVYSLLNLPLPRTAREQFLIGKDIPPEEVRRGDLIFFQTYADYASHVGIYLGDDRMIHASSGGKKVMISNLNTPYFRSRFLGARRIADLPEGEEEPLQVQGLHLPGLHVPEKTEILKDLASF
ncbi:MAG TPA: C40 family peptidase [Verrucomicrobiae bacterium]|nr:C40 family peptidase [Verrucomicrobiae bacterium]